MTLLFLFANLNKVTRLLIKKKPFFTTNQLGRISNIFDNAGQIVLGSTVIAPLFQTNNNVLLPMFGTLNVIVLWALSIFMARRS